MTTLYMPYMDDKPASIKVNGHDLLILSEDEELLLASEVMDVEYALPIESGSSEEELDDLLVEIAEEQNLGIVVAPEEVPLEDVVKNLETELPWLQ